MLRGEIYETVAEQILERMGEGKTPDWIKKIYLDYEKAWTVAFTLTADHPLITEEWTCLQCEEGFDMEREDKHFVVTAWRGADGGVWIATHRLCAIKMMTLPVKKSTKKQQNLPTQ